MVGKKSAVKNQSKQTDLILHSFLGLRTLEITTNKTPTEILPRSLAAVMPTASVLVMDTDTAPWDRNGSFNDCLLAAATAAVASFGTKGYEESGEDCSALLKPCTKKTPAQLQGSQTNVSYSPVFSGMEAWSVFLSFLKEMFPNCSTEDTTFSIAVVTRDIMESLHGGGWKGLLGITQPNPLS